MYWRASDKTHQLDATTRSGALSKGEALHPCKELLKHIELITDHRLLAEAND